MKSLLLTGLTSEAIAREALQTHLPGQENPWLLCSAMGDPIAYFSLDADLDGQPNIHIVADISGLHYNSDPQVREILQSLQSAIGGVIENDL